MQLLLAVVLSNAALAADPTPTPAPAPPQTKLNITLTPLAVVETPAPLVRRDNWTQSLGEIESAGIPKSWIVLGPRPDKDSKLFNQKLQADWTDDWALVPRGENGQSMAVASWTRPAEDEGCYVDLAEILQFNKPAVAYARTEVNWPVDGPALIWFDYDGFSRLYLNSKEVSFFGAGQENRKGVKDRVSIAVQMRKGRNVLKIKNGWNGNSGWGFFVRLERIDPAYRIAQLRRLLEIYPEESATWRGYEASLEIARALAKSDSAAALQAYQKILETCGNDVESRVLATQAIQNLKSNVKDIPAAVEQAWTLAEKDFFTCLARGDASGGDSALRDFVARFPESPHTGKALIYRGTLRQDQSLGDASRRYFERARREYPQAEAVTQYATPGLAWAAGDLPERLVFETSGEMQNTIKASARQMQAGNPEDTEKAMRGIGEILRASPLPLICLNDSRFYPQFTGVREYVRALIRSLDDRAREIYRSTVEKTAWEHCRRAAALCEPWGLEAMATEYPSTPAATYALNQAGNLYADRGALSQAGSAFGTLSRENKDSPMLCAKLAYFLLKDGQLDAAREQINLLAATFAGAKFNIAGRETTGAEYAAKLKAESAKAAPVLQSKAGDEIVQLFGAAPKEPCALEWLKPLFHSSTLSHAQSKFTGDPFTHLQSYPVAEGGRVIVSSLESIQALDAGSGRKLWSSNWKSAGSLLPRQFTGFPISVPAAKDGRVYLRISEGKQTALQCYVAETGMPRWSTLSLPQFRHTVWLSDPLIAYNLAIAVFLERSDDETNVHGVAAFDCDTGELRWKQNLLAGNTGSKIGTEYFAASMQLGPPVTRDGIVYTATGLGSLAALNAFSGEAIWVAGYPRLRLNHPSSGNSGITYNVQLRTLKLLSRGAISPALSGGAVVLAPKDAAGVFGFDRQTGSLLWKQEMLDARFVAGVCDGNIIFADDKVRALQAATGNTAWEFALPANETPLNGEPAYLNGLLFLPGRENLILLDAHNGQQKLARPWDARFGPVGNLAVAGERILGVSADNVVALNFKSGAAGHWPMLEAAESAAAGKWDVAAGKYLEAARGNDSADLLSALAGWTQAQAKAGRAAAALNEIEGLLNGKPEMLQSADGGWKIGKDVLSQALKARLGQAAPNPPQVVNPGINGQLAFAWHIEGEDARLVQEEGGAKGLWVYADPYLYSLKSNVAQDILWQNYIGVESPMIVIGRTALVVYNAEKLVVVDRGTGEVRWSFNLSAEYARHKDANIGHFTHVAMSEDTLAAVATDGLLVFDLITGKELWWNKARERAVWSLSFLDGNLVEYSGQNGLRETVYSVYEPRSGKIVKTVSHGKSEWTWSAVSHDPERVVTRPNPHLLKCVDLRSGEKVWEAAVPNIEFRWETSNLSLVDGLFSYHGEAKDGPDNGPVNFLFNPADGKLIAKNPHPGIKFGADILNIATAGWQQFNIIRSVEQPPQSGKWKDLWTYHITQEHGEGCRFRRAILSKDGTRLYLLITRDGVVNHFYMRVFNWANGQPLEEEILPGTPFANESWNIRYHGVCELIACPDAKTAASGGTDALFVYTGSDGVYAYSGAAEGRAKAAQSMRETLALAPATGSAAESSQRHAARKALAELEPATFAALLAPADVKTDSNQIKFETEQSLTVDKVENYTPLLPIHSGGEWHGPDDLSARVFAEWNQNGLFMAVETTDDKFVPPPAGSPLTNGDSITLAVNSSVTTRTGYDPRETFVCSMALVEGRSVISCESLSGEPLAVQPTCRVLQAADGIHVRYEAAFPWTLLRRDPAARPGNARELRFGLCVYDNDGAGAKGTLEWGEGISTGTIFPRWLGRLSLQDISRERLENYRKVIARIPDSNEALQYLRQILFNKRGANAVQEKEQVVAEFLKASPGGRNAVRALLYLRAAYKDAGIADAAPRAAALAKASLVPPEIIANMETQGRADGVGNGLEGEYFDNVDLTNLKVTRIDPTVDFEWTNKAPDPSMAATNFSVKWSGRVKPKYSENYTFSTLSDDGARLWVDGKLLVDNWMSHPALEESGTIALNAGVPYDITIEYFQGSSLSEMRLYWSSPSQKRQIIPKNCLYAPGIQPVSPKQDSPADIAKLQSAYRESADLLADSADGWVMLQKVLQLYPKEDRANRIQECQNYLKAHPETQNALPMLKMLEALYAEETAAKTDKGRTPLERCEELMSACNLSLESRRGFYAQRVPSWTEWSVLGPFAAAGENRGMDQALPPEKSVDLEWKTKGPLDLSLAWKKYVKNKDEWNPNGMTNLWRALLADNLPTPKREEVERSPYFAYAYRKVNVPAARRAALFFGVNDAISIWVNGRRVVNASMPGNWKDSQCVEVPLRQGENEILVKAGVAAYQLGFYFRIAEPSGRAYADLPKE